MSTTKKKINTYRLLEDGEELWRGKAYDAEHAEEKAFSDEPPGSIPRYTLQRRGVVKLSRQIQSMGWITVYKDERLSSH
jgi:hypothetical protein